jgi:hypothetical protein
MLPFLFRRSVENAKQRMQCFGRQWLARTIHKQLKKIKCQRNEAAIVLQRSWRRFSTYAHFRSVILDVNLIQSAFRPLQAQRDLKDRHDAIFCIQNAARVSLARKRFGEVLSAKLARELMKQCRSNYLLEKTAASKSERVAKGFIVLYV